MLESYINGGMLLFFRALGCVALVPMPSDFSGHMLKLALAFGLAALFAADAKTAEQVTVVLCGSEFLFGLMLGLPILLILNAASSAGELFDALRGQTIASMYDPTGDCPASLMGTFFSQYIWVLLIMLGGGNALAQHMRDSIIMIPCGRAAEWLINSASERVVALLATIMTEAFSICLPFAALCVLIDLSCAFLVKLFPGLYFQNEVFAVKSFVGFFLLLLLSETGYERSLLSVLLGSFQAL